MVLPRQEQQQPQSNVLSEPEKRLVLLQLYELEAARAKIAAYEEWIAKEQDLYAREKQLWQDKLDLSKKEVGLAEKERDLERDKAQFYQASYEAVTKKRGIGCFLKKVFTFGRSKCK